MTCARTFASWSVQAGVPPKGIANLMGHTSTRMVDLVYGRVGPSDYEAAIARLPGGSKRTPATRPPRKTVGRMGWHGMPSHKLRSRIPTRIP
jgi:hypothetical protein